MPHVATAQQTDLDGRHPDPVHATKDDRTDRSASTFSIIGAELFGTFLLVFLGLGVALYASQQGAGSLETALAFGVALIAGMAAVGHVSGGHFNPALTFGAALAGRTPWKLVPAYWISQVVGAAAAAAALFATIPEQLFKGDTATFDSVRDVFSQTANGFDEHSRTATQGSDTFWAGLAQYPQEQVDAAIESGELVVPDFTTFDLVAVSIVEIIAAALLMGVYLAVTDRRSRNRYAPVVVGLTFGLLLLLAMPLSGGSLNPARSLAAAIFSEGWALEQVWLFWAAPLVGAALAALFYRGFAVEEHVTEYGYDTTDAVVVSAPADAAAPAPSVLAPPVSDTDTTALDVDAVLEAERDAVLEAEAIPALDAETEAETAARVDAMADARADAIDDALAEAESVSDDAHTAPAPDAAAGPGQDTAGTDRDTPSK